MERRPNYVSGSNNSLVGIGGINGDNSIKGSFNKLNSFKVEDKKKNGIGSKNSHARIEAKKYGTKNTIDECSFKMAPKVKEMQLQVDEKNASSSNNSLVGIGVIIGENTIKESFQSLKTFEVDKKLEDKKKNGSGSNNSLVGNPVINDDRTIKNGKLKQEKNNGSRSSNSLSGIGVINGEIAFKDTNTMEGSFKQSETAKVAYKKQEYEQKEGSGSNNSLVGIGVINGGNNTIDRSFNQLETF